MTKKITPISEFSDEQKILILKIHAGIESLFMPYRFGRNDSGLCTVDESRCGAEIFSRRSAFFSRGGILVTGGGSGADRISLTRILESLASAGWLHTSAGRANRKGVYARFTEHADILLRESVGLYQLHDAVPWRLFQRIYSLQSGISGMVREDDLGEFDFAELTDDEQLGLLQWRLSPLLAVGLVDSHSDVCGYVGYCVSEPGEKVVMQKKPRRPSWLGCFDDVYDRRLADQHSDAFMEALRERNGWTSTSCCIPLGSGSWE